MSGSVGEARQLLRTCGSEVRRGAGRRCGEGQVSWREIGLILEPGRVEGARKRKRNKGVWGAIRDPNIRQGALQESRAA